MQVVKDLGDGRYESETVRQGRDARDIGLCAACGAPEAPSLCTGCRALRYCNKTCQKRHWRGGHKEKCAALRVSAAAAKHEVS